MNKIQSEFWKDIKNQPIVENWKNVREYILNSDQGYCLIRLQDIPIERNNSFSIAALSPRIEESFHLVGSKPLKNISFYGENTSLYCRSQYECKLVKHFNKNIICSKQEDDSLGLYLLDKEAEKSMINSYIQKLSKTEFVPPSCSGIIAAICHEEDLDTRKWLFKEHCILSKDIANIERSLIQICDQKDLGLLAVHALKDSKDHYHAMAVFEENSDIRFEQYSQSTTHNFAQNFINKI